MNEVSQTPEDEIGKLLAEDPNAHVVEGKPEVWLLSGPTAVAVARAAVGAREKD